MKTKKIIPASAKVCNILPKKGRMKAIQYFKGVNEEAGSSIGLWKEV